MQDKYSEVNDILHCENVGDPEYILVKGKTEQTSIHPVDCECNWVMPFTGGRVLLFDSKHRQDAHIEFERECSLFQMMRSWELLENPMAFVHKHVYGVFLLQRRTSKDRSSDHIFNRYSLFAYAVFNGKSLQVGLPAFYPEFRKSNFDTSENAGDE